MFKLEIAGQSNTCVLMRSCIGQVKAESKIKTPRTNIFEKQAGKVINIFGNVFTSAFRQCLKQQLPLCAMAFPEKIVKLYTEFAEVPGAYQALHRAGVELEFVNGALDFNTMKFPHTTSMKEWMKAKGTAFIAVNKQATHKTVAIEAIATNNLTSDIPAKTRSHADTAINLYNSRHTRPNYKGKASVMFNVIGSCCLKCGAVDNMSCDHVIPKSSRCDLSRSIINMQPLCVTCNTEKNCGNKDYRSDIQVAALFNKTFKYKLRPSEARVMSLYVEYGLTRAQIKQVLDVSDATIKGIMYEHELFITAMNGYIRGRRNYRLAYEARGVDTVTLFSNKD